MKNCCGCNDRKESIDIKNEIIRLKKQKNAVILGHFYLAPEVQDICDFLGDSLFLAQAVQKTDADIIVFAGVKFMAETAKIINPNRKVILPDFYAGCSLADSCKVDDFKGFIEKYPDHKVVTYINSSVEVKALSDVICTSSNVQKIIESFPEEQKLIFAPDFNLGQFISKQLNRPLKIWNGGCHVHKKFNADGILKLKAKYPEAVIIAHPECSEDILSISNFIGSTTSLLEFTKASNECCFIVATETGILHQMKRHNPKKIFLPAPTDASSVEGSNCEFMKLIDLNKIYSSLLFEEPEVFVDEPLRSKAEIPIIRMLEISAK